MKNQVRINERITAYRVMLILPDGTNKGEMLRVAAIELARQDGLDLVEVSGGATPVCKIMDYGKMLYEQKKREKHNVRHSDTGKEIRFKFNTGEHDLQIKKNKVKEFLQDGHKVLIAMHLSGREKYVAKGTAARDKFLAIVKEFSPQVKPSDIKEAGKGFSFVLYPSSIVP